MNLQMLCWKCFVSLYECRFEATGPKLVKRPKVLIQHGATDQNIFQLDVSKINRLQNRLENLFVLLKKSTTLKDISSVFGQYQHQTVDCVLVINGITHLTQTNIKAVKEMPICLIAKLSAGQQLVHNCIQLSLWSSLRL